MVKYNDKNELVGNDGFWQGGIYAVHNYMSLGISLYTAHLLAHRLGQFKTWQVDFRTFEMKLADACQLRENDGEYTYDYDIES